MNPSSTENEMNHATWHNLKSIYLLGGISTIFVLACIIIDLIFGFSSGGNLDALPQTAVERFEQLQSNFLLGLYNLDLLNAINQLIMIPVYFALFIVHKKLNYSFSLLALIIFLVGTILFVANNTALTMLDLSNKYYSTTTDSQKLLLAGAGEAMLAKGAHGSLSAFIGFLLPNLAGILMSIVMIRGKIFSKLNGYLGLIGGMLIVVYLIMVTFMPSVKSIATLIVAPGGLLTMAWMIMFTIRFFKLVRLKN